MEYECNDCGMGVKGLTCSKCGKPLVNDTVSVKGQKVQVAKCPNSCGMIKSPQCCGHDMHAQG
jgi:DNA-directed RNA polymerase subunit RPC12/RpoP